MRYSERELELESEPSEIPEFDKLKNLPAIDSRGFLGGLPDHHNLPESAKQNLEGDYKG